jgi:hypothetical protein
MPDYPPLSSLANAYEAALQSLRRPDTSQEQVRFTTASPLVNISDEDINRGMNIAMSAGPGAIAGKPVSGTMAGIRYQATPEQAEMLKTARRGGAGPAEIQKLVDSFGTTPNLATTIEKSAAPIQESSGRVMISDLHEAMPDMPLDKLHEALLQMERDRKIALYPQHNVVELTAADKAAALGQGAKQRHMFYPLDESGSIKPLK